MTGEKMTSNKAMIFSTGLRRAVVGVMYGGYVAFAALWHISRTHHSTGLSIAAVAMLLFSLGAFGMLFTGTSYWNWSHKPDRQLDEREVSVRNLAYRFAFTGYVTLTFLALVYCSVAADGRLVLPSWSIDGQWLVWGSLLLGLTLPGAVLAWIDPHNTDEE